VANVDRNARLRYALSYREKARSLSERVPPPSHAERAQLLIDSLLDELRREIAALGEELLAALAEQSVLYQRATAGRITASKANERNRELTVTIGRLRDAIAERHALLSAKGPAELGGFIDLPIEEYAAIITAPGSTETKKGTGILSALIEDKPTIAGIQLKPTRLGLVVWAACIVAAVLAASWHLGLLHWGGTAMLDVAAGKSSTDPVVITIRNNGRVPMEVYVPLPEGGVWRTEGEAGNRVYGLRAWAREDGGREYRVLPASLDCWVRQTRFDENPALVVAAGLTAQILFDSAKLKTLGSAVQSLRIAIVRSNGSVVVQRSVDLR